MEEQQKMDGKFQRFVSGLIIVKSKNSNFNADFTGTPRRLPDRNGTIYATDKSVKYCIRKYLNDKLENSVFVWRRKKPDDQPMDINENYDQLFDKTLENSEKKDILKNLTNCIDVRLFGVTFTPRKGESSKNTSITGPVQISYGIDKYSENIHYTNQISSPYRDPKDKGAQQTTIGDESKGLESHYVFDYIINYRHLDDNINHLEDNTIYLSKTDISNFKEAARLGVNNVNSTSKIGSENELLLYIEYSKSLCLQNLKDFVQIKGENGESIIDLRSLESYLKEIINDDTVNIELFYDPAKTKIKGFENSIERAKMDIKRYHIITEERINNSR